MIITRVCARGRIVTRGQGVDSLLVRVLGVASPSSCDSPGSRPSFCTKGPVAKDKGKKGDPQKKPTISSFRRRSDREINLFGPRDPRTPFPGNIGPETFNTPRPKKKALSTLNFLNPLQEDPDVITNELNIERQARIIDHLVFPGYMDQEPDTRLMQAMETMSMDAHSCPELVINDLQDLFPSMNFGKNLTVITVTQKSINDMTTWNPLMQGEREEMMEKFIMLAQTVVGNLQELGYWADFIDPFSGRPIKGPFTNSTFFETDERYRHFGFEIEDMGCCKVVKHHKWGTKAFIGSLFTTASADSKDVIELLFKINSC